MSPWRRFWDRVWWIQKQQQIKQELFDQAKKDLLIQALLAPAPEITTSQQAISSEAQGAEEAEEAEEIEAEVHP